MISLSNYLVESVLDLDDLMSDDFSNKTNEQTIIDFINTHYMPISYVGSLDTKDMPINFEAPNRVTLRDSIFLKDKPQIKFLGGDSLNCGGLFDLVNEFSVLTITSQNDKSVLKNLNGCPNSNVVNIEQSTIASLKGSNANINVLTIKDCKNLKDLSNDLNVKKWSIRDCDNLLSLKGCSTINSSGHVIIKNCHKLKDLTGASDLNSISINGCDIKSLKGCPSGVKSLHIENENDLISFEGCADSVDTVFISNCSNLKSLEGIPDKLEFLSIKNCPKLDYNTIPKTKQIEVPKEWPDDAVIKKLCKTRRSINRI